MEVFPEDQGQYICVAENPAGQATTSAFLAIMEPKQIHRKMAGQSVDETDGNYASHEEGNASLETTFSTGDTTRMTDINELVAVVEESVVPKVIGTPKLQPINKDRGMDVPDFDASAFDSLVLKDAFYSTVAEEVQEPVTLPTFVSQPQLVAFMHEEYLQFPKGDDEDVCVMEREPSNMTRLSEDRVFDIASSTDIKPEEILAENVLCIQENASDEIPVSDEVINVHSAEIDASDTALNVICPDESADQVMFCIFLLKIDTWPI